MESCKEEEEGKEYGPRQRQFLAQKCTRCGTVLHNCSNNEHQMGLILDPVLLRPLYTFSWIEDGEPLKLFLYQCLCQCMDKVASSLDPAYAYGHMSKDSKALTYHFVKEPLSCDGTASPVRSSGSGPAPLSALYLLLWGKEETSADSKSEEFISTDMTFNTRAPARRLLSQPCCPTRITNNFTQFYGNEIEW